MKKLLAILLAAVMCFSLCACGSSSSEKNLDEEIKIAVQGQASYYCTMNYPGAKTVLATITDQDDNGDGTYDVKGYINITNSYGDKYEAKYDAVVAVYDSGDATCKDFEMDTPKRELIINE